MTKIFVATTKRKKKDLLLSNHLLTNMVAILILAGLCCKLKLLNNFSLNNLSVLLSQTSVNIHRLSSPIGCDNSKHSRGSLKTGFNYPD